jgi:hypothetical protein
MYDKGQGVKQDYNQAVNWYHKAADQGYAKAQDNLSIMYYEGLGVKQDFVKAHILWKLGSVNSDVNSLKNSSENFSKDRNAINNNVISKNQSMVTSKLASR